MEKQKGVKKVNLFSSEGRNTLKQLVQAHSERVDSDVLQLEQLVQEEGKGESTSGRLPGDLHCHSCHVTFTGREEQVEHYKLDWHRNNLKRKLKLLPSISQDDFESTSGMGDMSSISGSESDTSNDVNEVGVAGKGVQVQGSPLLVFTGPDGTNHALYRCLLAGPKDSRNEVDTEGPLSELATPTPKPWVILMRSGGHFAGAVFRGSSVLCHKTFHRYTVRAKQGTMQSSRDSHGGGHKPKSAGASLRRYNEAALEQEISDLVLSWRQYIQEASLIFVRAPKHRRVMFTNGRVSLIESDDNRLRSIPFMTRRPTFSELKSVVIKLSTIYTGVQSPCYHGNKTTSSRTNKMAVPDISSSFIDKVTDWLTSSSDEVSDINKDNVRKKRSRRKKKANKSPVPPLLDEVDPFVRELHDMVAMGNEGGINQLLSDHGITTVEQSVVVAIVDQSDVTTTGDQSDVTSIGDQSVVTATVDQSDVSKSSPINTLYSDSTVLHKAAANGHSDIVYTLLLHGADPNIRDSASRVPYLVCKDRPTRDSFRRFMGMYPSAHDYTPSLIPAPLTEAMEEERRGKKNERKKAQKKAQQKRKKERMAEEELQTLEKERQTMEKGLSDREKRALAAERRLAAMGGAKDVAKYGVCSWCGGSLCGVVAFERLSHKYCRIECVKEHRLELQRTSN